ncbi:MAG: hypothetical protein VR64_11550 [Desulfatitalea sp. BRH_c12]|nr:MAG: hypothetical protein VR64_11550 [Desulfatitalea sp. BRH_c12]
MFFTVLRDKRPGRRRISGGVLQDRQQPAAKCKRIFIFRHYASPPTLPGSTRHHYLAKAMRNDGDRPFIFASAYHHFLKRSVRHFPGFFSEESCDGIPYVWLKGVAYRQNGLRRLIGMLHYAANGWRAAWKYRAQGIRPDIVIGSVAHSFAAIAAYCVARINKAAFWLDIGDIWPEGLIRAGTLRRHSPLAILLKLISRVLYRKAELIIVLNTDARKFLEDLGVNPAKIILLPSGIPFEKADAAQAVAREDQFRMIYSGALGPLYPIAEAVKAFREVQAHTQRKILLEIVGEGPDKERIKAAAGDLLGRNIFFRKLVPKSKLQAIYKQADALLLVEKDVAYGFPNKLIDYLMAAKPIILASHNQYGLGENHVIQSLPTAAALTAAIGTALHLDRRQRESLGLNAFSFGQAHFDIMRNYARSLKPFVKAQPHAPSPSLDGPGISIEHLAADSGFGSVKR